jgi:hypothetical protein
VTLTPVADSRGVSEADLAALESRIYSRLRTEMEQRVRLVSTHGATDSDLEAQMRALRAWQQDQTDQNLHFARDIGDMYQRTNDLGRRMAAQQNVALQPGR